jgi:nucleotide-binding universal stress UspA family protein
MYKKILVPLDGSAVAETVLPHVQDIAERGGSEILLLSVTVEPSYDLLFTGAKLAAASMENEMAPDLQAKIYLKSVGARLEQDGLDVSTEVRTGRVADTVLSYADESGADLIVLCARGRGQHEGFALGSITYRVMRGAHVPVLLIH